MKRVIAKLLLNETASLEFFKQCTQDLIVKSRAEDGNLSYDLYQHVEDSRTFLFVERYRDQEALDTHFSSEHLSIFLTNVTSLLKTKPDIMVEDQHH